jgi:hypothetical protein
MKNSIDRQRAEVERAVAEARSLADSDRPRSLFEFERELWTLMLALGRALVCLFLARQVARPRATAYQHDGRRYVLGGERTTTIGTRFGKVPFTRPIGQPLGRRARCDLKIDRELGLCAGLSLGVVMALARLSAQMAFASARETFQVSHEWTPSPRAVLRMVDAVGDLGGGFLRDARALEGDGEVLVIQVDAGGAPMISAAEHLKRRVPHKKDGRKSRRHRRQMRVEAPRRRRTKGEKSKNAKMAFVGVIYTLERTADGWLEGPINKRMVATFESHEALFEMLLPLAIARGYGTKKTEFIADGSEHIWSCQERYFPKAECCLDWAHVVEKLWQAGTCIYPEGSAALRSWVAKQTRILREGAVIDVITNIEAARKAIPKTGPGNKSRRQRLFDIWHYFGENEARMNYRKLRAADLDIGSGAVEGAVRNLVRMRLDGPGMRWSRGRAERLLHLRCILLNGQWNEFEEHVAAQGLALKPIPVPTQTHDAKSAA